VVVNYSSNSERAEKLLGELSGLSSLPKDGDGDSKSKNFILIKADLGSRSDIIRLVQETVDHFGRIDVIFSNGGWTRVRGLASIDDNIYEDEWDRAFNMNVKSHLWLMHAAKKHLEETEGAFITTASLGGTIHAGSSLVSEKGKH
jgi:NAD(P)-dependent dehydrogenase (short-subunit alcohol dehydrogenase family)